MKFKMPTASRKRLEELLTYLGDRAKDFRKCFDIESEWCWKYADLVIRGFTVRKLKYAEGHHIIPASFYGTRRTKRSDAGNLVKLTYIEHLYAHYCAARCAIGKMSGYMANAFNFMYNIGVTGKRPLLPEEKDFIKSLPEREVARIRQMMEAVSKVEAEGRTHFFEDRKQAQRDFWNQNRDRLCEQKRRRYREDKPRINKKNAEWRKAHPEKMKEYRDKWSTNNKDWYEKEYRKTHKEHLRRYKREWYHTHKESHKAYAIGHTEHLKEYHHNYYAENKDRITVRQRQYVAAHREEDRARKKRWEDAKKAAGYRYRKDPETGKHHWVFVGKPATPETSKSSTTAA